MPATEATCAPGTLQRAAAAQAASRRYHRLGLAIKRAAKRHDMAAIARLGEQAWAEREQWQALVKEGG